MLFFDLLVLFFVVKNLFDEQVVVVLLTRVLDLKFLLLVFELAMFFVQLLGHLSHQL